MDCQQTRCATALCKDFAHAVPRRFWRDHDHVNVCRRCDGLEVNVEAVRKQERFACRECGRDCLLIELWLYCIGYKDDQNVAPRGRVIWRIPYGRTPSIKLSITSSDPVASMTSDSVATSRTLARNASTTRITSGRTSCEAATFTMTNSRWSDGTEEMSCT